MAYNVELSAEVDRELGKLDAQQAKRILKFVSVKRTPSCKRVGPIALLRHDQALKEGVEEVAKTDPRTCA